MSFAGGYSTELKTVYRHGANHRAGRRVTACQQTCDCVSAEVRHRCSRSAAVCRQKFSSVSEDAPLLLFFALLQYPKKMKRSGVKLLDLPILLLSLAALLASVLLLRRGGGDEKHVIIRTAEAEYVYPLSKDAVYQIEGSIGISEIEISGGTVRFLDSPCPSKTCVMTGALSEPGQWAACLPNEVFVRIEGSDSDKNGLDAVAQ